MLSPDEFAKETDEIAKKIANLLNGRDMAVAGAALGRIILALDAETRASGFKVGFASMMKDSLSVALAALPPEPRKEAAGIA